MKHRWLFWTLIFGFALTGNDTLWGQNGQEVFTMRDSLLGGLRPERTDFNVLHYDLKFRLDLDKQYISGRNSISFEATRATDKIQIDLYENMLMDSVVWEGKSLAFERIYGAVFVSFPEILEKGRKTKVNAYFQGQPIEAKNPPWDGGFVWRRDRNKNPFIGVAVQGMGASLWFPVKDSQTDEPDFGAKIQIQIPKGLVGVSNGRLIDEIEVNEKENLWVWEVNSPINSYNIVFYVGDYVHWTDRHNGLDLDYYVLRENEAKSKIQFEEVKPMMDCFEEKFGLYPFRVDGFKLVESPYLGMEHQSAVAYGNKYTKGYLGSDISRTGVGKLFDYIIIHETAHEWFGNSITSKDIGDMWIHESFTTYAETVYIECRWGYEKANTYINGQRKLVENRRKMIGPMGVNFKGGNSDIYFKGALVLHTLRHFLNDDPLWWKTLRNFAEHFRHAIIETEDVIVFFEKETQRELRPFFEAYLNHAAIPILEVELHKNHFTAKWNVNSPGFQLPFEVRFDGKSTRFEANESPSKFKMKLQKKGQPSFESERFLYDVKITDLRK